MCWIVESSVEIAEGFTHSRRHAIDPTGCGILSKHDRRSLDTTAPGRRCNRSKSKKSRLNITASVDLDPFRWYCASGMSSCALAFPSIRLFWISLVTVLKSDSNSTIVRSLSNRRSPFFFSISTFSEFIHRCGATPICQGRDDKIAVNLDR